MPEEQSKKADIWGRICVRANVERPEGEEGYPSNVPQTFSFDWFNFKRELQKFQVGETSPLSAEHKIVAIFEDEVCARIYGVPEKPAPERFPVRWTVQKTAPTHSLTRYLDTDTLFDSLAADLGGYAAEFDEVLDEDEEVENGQPTTAVVSPPST